MKSRLTLTLGIGLLTIYSIGCSASFSTGDGTSPASPSPASSPTGVASPSAPSTTSSAPKDISGEYSATGSNPDGTPYKADLAVKKQGEVYQFSWKSGPSEYDGVGVENGGVIAVAFANGADGKGCSVVNYEIGSDGTLDGKWGEWGISTSGTETAKRTGGSGLEGKYDATGKRLDGKDYKGTIDVKAEGAGYKFVWTSGGTTDGFGIKQGETVSVGIGGKQCGFVAYTVGADGSLDGKWGASGTTTIGTEKAVKK